MSQDLPKSEPMVYKLVQPAIVGSDQFGTGYGKAWRRRSTAYAATCCAAAYIMFQPVGTDCYTDAELVARADALIAAV